MRTHQRHTQAPTESPASPPHAGTYRVTRKLYIRGPVVLRGAGRDSSTLLLPKSMSEVRPCCQGVAVLRSHTGSAAAVLLVGQPTESAACARSNLSAAGQVYGQEYNGGQSQWAHAGFFINLMVRRLGGSWGQGKRTRALFLQRLLHRRRCS